MSSNNRAFISEIRARIYTLRIRRVLLTMGALLWMLSGGSTFAQIDPAQLIDHNSMGSPTISKNQLLAPVKAVRAIERANQDIRGGHLESAQNEIARALDIAPHFALAKVLKGAIDLETDNYQEASTLFQQAIDDDSGLGAAYVGMAVVLMHQQQFQAALPLLDRAEGLLPGAWFVHFAKAWVQLETGNSESALKQADIAERIAGPDPEKRSGVSYLRAMVSIHLNDMETAREHLAETVARDRGGQYAALGRMQMERLQVRLTATR